MNSEQVSFIKNHNSVDKIQEVRYVLTDKNTNQLKAVSVKDTIDHWIFELSKGAMPEKGEVLIPDSLKQPNGASYIVGDNITVNFIAGGKSYQSIYKVAGIFSDYSISRNYIFLDDVSFIELQEQFKDIELIKNIYVNVKNDTGELVSDYFHKYNRRDAIVNDPALNIVRIYPEFISLYIILVSSAMLVGSVCIYTVVSLYLKDSNKDYIVFRLLGANNRQLIYIILAQLLILLFISLPPIQSLQQQSNEIIPDTVLMRQKQKNIIKNPSYGMQEYRPLGLKEEQPFYALRLQSVWDCSS